MRRVGKEDIHNPLMAQSGEIIYELIGRDPDKGETTQHSFALVVIPPGKSSYAHYHKASEETYYVLKGEGSMVVDSQEFQLRPGQACLIQPLEIHQIFNKGEVDLEFLAVSAPAWTPDDSFFTHEQ